MSQINFPPNAYGLSLSAQYNPLVRMMMGLPQASPGIGGPLQPQPQQQPRIGAGMAIPQAPRPYTGAGSQPANNSNIMGQVSGLNTALQGLKGLWPGAAAPAAIAPDMSLGGTMAGLGPEASFMAPGTGMDMGAIGAGDLGIDTSIAPFIDSSPIWTGAGAGALDAAGIGAGAAGADAGAAALGAGALDAGLAAGAGEAAAGAAAAGGAEAAGAGIMDFLPMLLAFL